MHTILVCLLLLVGTYIALAEQDEAAHEIECAATIRVQDAPLTVLASFPRSGNSYTRWMVESLSNAQTSSVYCDKKLQKKLKGECDKSLTWLKKTHTPMFGIIPAIGTVKRALVLVRNPFDALKSFWSFSHGGGHEGKTNPTSQQLASYVKTRRGDWKKQVQYWTDTKKDIERIYVRYEDERSDFDGQYMRAVVKWLARGHSTPQLTEASLDQGWECVVHGHNTPYSSHAYPILHSLDLFLPSSITETLTVLHAELCMMGYDRDIFPLYSSLQLACPADARRLPLFSVNGQLPAAVAGANNETSPTR